MIRSVMSDKVEIRDTSLNGKGIYAKENIKAGEIVFIKGGHILTRDKIYSSSVINSYFPISDEYFLAASNQEEEEAIKLYQNHSCNPNVGLHGEITFVDVSNFYTPELENMSNMFANCSVLKEVKFLPDPNEEGQIINTFVTDNVTTMRNLFANDRGLLRADLGGFHTPKVTDMYRVFNGCTSLTYVDFRNLDLTSVTTVSSFLLSSKLVSFNLSGIDKNEFDNTYLRSILSGVTNNATVYVKNQDCASYLTGLMDDGTINRTFKVEVFNASA